VFELVVIISSPIFVIGGNAFILTKLKKIGKDKIALLAYSVLFCLMSTPL